MPFVETNEIFVVKYKNTYADELALLCRKLSEAYFTIRHNLLASGYSHYHADKYITGGRSTTEKFTWQIYNFEFEKITWNNLNVFVSLIALMETKTAVSNKQELSCYP